MKWEKSRDLDPSWNRWTSGEPNDNSECGMVHPSLGHLWTTEDCDLSSAVALGLCQWKRELNILIYFVCGTLQSFFSTYPLIILLNAAF